tara:strand:- start:10 stop:486 length:477 start_codon:yes stop_codon:yes gene_type:complete
MKLEDKGYLLIKIVGKPAAQGSKVRTRYGMKEASQFVAPWRNQIVSACIEQRINEGEMITCPVRVDIRFQFHRPKAHFGTGKNKDLVKASAPRFPSSKIIGDIDKLCRSTLDGLSVPSGGMLLEDDSLVVKLKASKTYIKKESETTHQGAWIRVSKLT